MTGDEERSVHVPSKLVVAERGSLAANIGPADSPVALPLIGVQRGIAEVLIRGAMKIAAAALGDDADLAGRRSPILGAVVGRKDLYFLNCIHVGGANARTVRT